jgi:excisionase family DNA binding protein
MSTIADRRPRTRLLTIKDVAVDLNVSIKTVRRTIERGELRVHRMGRTIRIGEDEVDLFRHRASQPSTCDHHSTNMRTK